MSDTLHRGDRGIPGAMRVTRLPTFVAPSNQGLYWHRPRSAQVYDGRLCVTLWCGQTRPRVEAHHLTDKAPDDLLCGTCEGRWLGWKAVRDDLVFRPRSVFDLPSYCPTLVASDARTCWLCGNKPSYRRGSCYYDEVRHRLGDGSRMPTPCNAHGWQQIGQERDKPRALVCRGWGVGKPCAWRWSV